MAQIVLREGKAGIIAGLSWGALTSDNRDAAVRERARELDAKKVIVLSQSVRQVVGAGDLDEVEGERTPGVLHSLAALVCQHVWEASADPGSENVVVAYKLPFSGGDLSRELCAIVVIDAGLPVLDDVRVVDQAQSIASDFLSGGRGFSNYKLLTNDLDAFPAGELISDENILAQLGKTTQLGSPPVDSKKALIVIAIVSAVLVAGGWYTKVYKPAKLKREAALREAAQNPLPRYKAELEGKIRRLGVDRQAMVGVLTQIEKYPIWVKGWALASVSCEEGSCLATWERRGGTLDDLKAALPSNEVKDGGFANAVLKFAVDMPQVGLADQRLAMKQPLAVERSTNIYQMWSNAQIMVSVGGVGYVAWPKGDYSVTDLPPEETLKTQPVEVRVVFPLAKEVVLGAPADVWWKSIKVRVSPRDKTESLTTELKGVSYVR